VTLCLIFRFFEACLFYIQFGGSIRVAKRIRVKNVTFKIFAGSTLHHSWCVCVCPFLCKANLDRSIDRSMTRRWTPIVWYYSAKNARSFCCKHTYSPLLRKRVRKKKKYIYISVIFPCVLVCSFLCKRVHHSSGLCLACHAESPSWSCLVGSKRRYHRQCLICFTMARHCHGGVC